MSQNSNVWNVHISKDKSVFMWCPKCGLNEELLIHTLVKNPPTQTGKAINNDSICIFTRCEANCLSCGTKMIEMDAKFVEVCEKLRSFDIKILHAESAYYTPYRGLIPSDCTSPGNKSDTYCSGASITLKFGSDRYMAWTVLLDENDEFISNRIQAQEDVDLGGITISSTFDLLEGMSRFGFLNKEEAGGDERLKSFAEISDDHLIEFLEGFIECIEEYGE